MDKKDYEEKAKRAIMSEEGNTDNSQPQENPNPNPEYKSLGKVIPRTLKDRESTDEQIEFQKTLGYTDLLLENLPSTGRFYPIGTKISIRPANVREIRHFSTMEELNPFDVDDKLNSLLIACSRIDLGNKKGSFKDLLEEDRIYIILSIKEMTFKQGENKLTLRGKCSRCETENAYELKTNNLQYYDEDETIGKYYDENERCYVFRTKESGVIKMVPPLIGVMKTVTDYIREKEEKKEAWDKSFMQILPYIVKDWRNFDSKSIFNYEVDFQGWNIKKFNLIFSLAEKMKVGVKEELKHPCANCGEEVTIPISFPGGVKALFVDKSFPDELL
jgi:uncharacterized metal-binding protein YceD (DUF177 family)